MGSPEAALLAVLEAFWSMLLEVSWILLLAFILAAVIKVYVPPRLISSLLGGKARSILAAALIGIPLPLCSCSVLPVAVSLRRAGASLGAVFSFIVSAPVVSVLAILLTLKLLGPLFAVAYLLASIAISLAMGFIIQLYGGGSPPSSAVNGGGCCRLSCTGRSGRTYNQEVWQRALGAV
ncbi:MAG TPA: hypothetical protein ENF82_01650 [Candidatus Methanomethylia archaeon]|nr:hypothetical protein [Candidatus Methanomethylicia archaeon]